MKQSSQFTVTIPPNKLRRLNALAKEDGRSRNNYVLRVLDRHFAAQEGKTA
jgi:hypothetical protein